MLQQIGLRRSYRNNRPVADKEQVLHHLELAMQSIRTAKRCSMCMSVFVLLLACSFSLAVHELANITNKEPCAAIPKFDRLWEGWVYFRPAPHRVDVNINQHRECFG